MKCKNCGKPKIEHPEFPNYDSKALENSCEKFVEDIRGEQDGK